jgi:hypothetical protein
MGDAYRDGHEAALMQLEALRRENAELRERLERARAVAAAEGGARGDERLSPSVLAVMLVSMFFLVGAVIYAGAVANLQHARARETRHCPYLEHAALARVEPGALRVEVEAVSAPLVEVDGVMLDARGGVATSGPLEPGRAHHVVVRAAGCEPYEYDAFVHPGVTRTVRVALTPDACNSAP